MLPHRDRSCNSHLISHQVYIKDRPDVIIVRAATLRQKLQLKLDVSPSYSILKLDHPLTLLRQALGRAVIFTFHLSLRLCPSTVGCSRPPVPSVISCLLFSYSRSFSPSLLCRLAIFFLVVPLIPSLSLAATQCRV